MDTSDTQQNGRDARQFQPRQHRKVSDTRTPDEQAEQFRQDRVASERARFWYAVKVACLCVVACIIGLIPMAWALHTTDVEAGMTAWKAGPPLGTTLIALILMVAANRWQRDDW